jgi:Rps23 Pro-64 3,4-dihydroxylase Tpa1-like proline 4-hydroxylase
MIKKIIDYQGKKIISYEGVFNRRENLGIYDLIVNASFSRTNIDVYLLNNLDRDAKWWSTIDPNSQLSSLINPTYMSTIDELDWSRVAVTGQYINYSTASTVDFLHADISENKDNCYTIIHYANHTWNANWHGETIFYSDDCQQVVHTQMIKPGTVLLFDSRIQHSAVPCTISAEHPRFTIATKLFLRP